MTAVSPLKALAEAIRDVARVAAAGVLQVRVPRGRPATATHVGPDLAVTPLHALDRDDNLRVVRGDAALDAVVAGRDEALDLALLRVGGLGPPPLTLGSGDPAGAGQLVVAVARSWQGDLMAQLASVIGQTCPQRRWRAEPAPSLLRTDVAVGRGISGGILVNADGIIVGWLTTGLSRGSVLGIPAALLEARIAKLARHGRIRRGYIGLAVQPVTLPAVQQGHATHGLLVSGIDGMGPGIAAGLFIGDILLSADARPLTAPGELQLLLSEERIGTTLPLQVLRGTSIHDIALTVGERAR